MRIGILSDDAGKGLARRVADTLAEQGHEVVLESLTLFPIADALPALLHSRRDWFEHLVVALGDSSRHRSWVVAELAHGALYEGTSLAVERVESIPTWGTDRTRVLVPGDPLPRALQGAARSTVR